MVRGNGIQLLGGTSDLVLLGAAILIPLEVLNFILSYTGGSVEFLLLIAGLRFGLFLFFVSSVAANLYLNAKAHAERVEV